MMRPNRREWLVSAAGAAIATVGGTAGCQKSGSVASHAKITRRALPPTNKLWVICHGTMLFELPDASGGMTIWIPAIDTGMSPHSYFAGSDPRNGFNIDDMVSHPMPYAITGISDGAHLPSIDPNKEIVISKSKYNVTLNTSSKYIHAAFALKKPSGYYPILPNNNGSGAGPLTTKLNPAPTQVSSIYIFEYDYSGTPTVPLPTSSWSIQNQKLHIYAEPTTRPTQGSNDHIHHLDMVLGWATGDLEFTNPNSLSSVTYNRPNGLDVSDLNSYYGPPLPTSGADPTSCVSAFVEP